jgi:hypothetical protein
MKRFFLIALFSFILISCKEDASNITNNESDNIIPIVGPSFSGMSINFGPGINEPDALIKIYLGKIKDGHTHCSGIFAICPNQKIYDPVTCSYSGMELCIKIYHDGTDPLPFELHLIDDPSTIIDPIEDFEIDDDILLSVTDMPFDSVKIAAGEYTFDNQIGIYGGFTIPVIGF